MENDTNSGPPPAVERKPDLITSATRFVASSKELIAALTSLGVAISSLAAVPWLGPPITAVLLTLCLAIGGLAIRAWRRRGRGKGTGLRGLQPFEAGGRFYGRTRETDLLATRTLASQLRFVVLSGEAKSGKTSLVRAGLEPAAASRSEPIATCYVETTVQFAEQVRARLADALKEVPIDLRAAVRQTIAARRQPLLITCDGFEEIYRRLPDPAERAAALRPLWECVEDFSLDVRVLVVVRSEFVDLLVRDYETALRRPLPDLNRVALRGFQPRDAENVLRQLVDEDVPRQRRRLSNDLCAEIVEELEHDGVVCPAEMQVVATRLRDEDPHILTIEQLVTYGGVSRVLADFISARIHGTFDPREVSISKGVLRALVDGDGDPPMVNLAALTAAVTEGIPDPTAAALVESILERMVTNALVKAAPNQCYGLVHNYLKPYVKSALDALPPPPPRPHGWSPVARKVVRASAMVLVGLLAVIGLFALAAPSVLRAPYLLRTLAEPDGGPRSWTQMEFDPGGQLVAAQAGAVDSDIVLWDLRSETPTSWALAHPELPDTFRFKRWLPLALDFSGDSSHVRLMGVSHALRKVWILSWEVDHRDQEPVLLWADFRNTTSSDKVCAPLDIAYNEHLEQVAVSYGSAASESGTDCNLVTLSDVKVVDLTSDPSTAATPSAKFEQTSAAQACPPVKLAFDHVSDLLYVLTTCKKDQANEHSLLVLRADFQPQYAPRALAATDGDAERLIVGRNLSMPQVAISTYNDPGLPGFLSTLRLGPFQPAGKSVELRTTDGGDRLAYLNGLARIAAVGLAPDGKLISASSDEVAGGSLSSVALYRMQIRIGPIRIGGAD